LFRWDAFQQEWQQPDAMFFREARIYVCKLCDIGFAVIRRQLHAHQQHPGPCLSRLFDDVAQVGFDTPDWRAAQSVVCAELHDYNSRAKLLQCPGDAFTPAGGGLAADAGVHDAEAGLGALQFLLQQIDPTFVYREAIAR